MSGMSNYLRNKIVDWFHRQVSYTPPTSVWVALCSSAPNASVAGTELTGSGYGRVEIVHGTTQFAATNAAGSTAGTSTGTSGTTSNNAIVDYGTAAAAWGTASHWESYDASTGGNRLHHGDIVDSLGAPAPRSISLGDPVAFPISALRWLWG